MPNRYHRLYEPPAEWLEKQKAGPCVQCGWQGEAFCKDFHHRNKDEKEFPINSRTVRCKSRARVIAEIAKCDLLCAICHRREEYGRHADRARAA